MASVAASNVPAATGPAHTALDEMGKAGEFKRTEAGWRSSIEPGGRFEPEGGWRRSRLASRARALTTGGSSSHRQTLGSSTCGCNRGRNAVLLAVLLPVPRLGLWCEVHGCRNPPTTLAPLSLAAAGRYHLYISYACPWWVGRCVGRAWHWLALFGLLNTQGTQSRHA